ncbi:diaminopimelate aminotransferase [Oceanidesulfovibrio indonesiensis]|uniref:Diaminopimelate aminotransferase n=1 Tax=Oceanidesulfovibrio indonesiensis TaxID=54767 RepID=A0A7M3MG60_9BACT|nr:M20 family metallo-hydrolase [Oceanidesulfovibrio indonesiensis]TVM18312.1 diaminopimelate aminotransferase [Oceanidesulfovibrio indonesiensis]
MSNPVYEYIDKQRETVIDLQKHLVSLPALGPENEGPADMGPGHGEMDKARYLEKYLNDLGIGPVVWVNAPDHRVPESVRPNIAATLPGRSPRTLWVISHMDVVPSGDLSLWIGDPFTLRVEGDVLYGRGVEDNHQGIVSSLVAARAFKSLDITPEMGLGLLFVADEETGSGFGLDYVLKHRPELFGADDLFLVPDFGTSDSTLMEVAEKHMLWLKISVIGRQCHASTPNEGVNSLVGAAAFIMKLRELYAIFDKKDALFDPPVSTFEPTRKDANVPNVNTVPGKDVFYLDCRILPEYAIDDVLGRIKEIGAAVTRSYGVTLEYEVVQRNEAAQPTDVKSEVVSRLADGIKDVYGVTAKPQGIGGGTVAAFLRRAGHPAVVWSTCIHNAHQPNERSLISSQLGDAKVIAHMLGANGK